VAAGADAVFLSLPDGPVLERVVFDAPGHLGHALEPGAVLVDHTTAPVALTRRIAGELADHGVHFLDAPVARTRAAAVDGTLAIMVGGEAEVLDEVRPLLAHMGTEIRHCGPVGCGQIAKLMNNKVLAETVVALADALTIGRRAGIDGEALFGALAAGSADSFALRNHGMKALLPGDFPAQAFSANYMLKDLTYALELAEEAGVESPTARAAARRLREAIEAGDGDAYFPVLLKRIEDEGQ
jgi:3-hydroxyisobutyrate dehydrogenase-like beta-hydroxyacid dehydrogenase